MPENRGHLKAVLSPDARPDLHDALRWSEAKIGYDAKLRYEALIRLSRGRARTAPGIVHNPRHFILYRRENVIDIGRILHDRSDLQRHLPENYRRDSGD